MYPTPEQILKIHPLYKKGIKEIMKTWKEKKIKGWKNNKNTKKIKLIKELLNNLATLYEKPIKKIKISNEDAYNTKTETIYLNKENPSIISALHEFGHHILGKSELKACRWSVWLFKETFPGLYNKLKWKDHLLIKK